MHLWLFLQAGRDRCSLSRARGKENRKGQCTCACPEGSGTTNSRAGSLAATLRPTAPLLLSPSPSLRPPPSLEPPWPLPLSHRGAWQSTHGWGFLESSASGTQPTASLPLVPSSHTLRCPVTSSYTFACHGPSPSLVTGLGWGHCWVEVTPSPAECRRELVRVLGSPPCLGILGATLRPL